jgi:hypothetical protein
MTADASALRDGKSHYQQMPVAESAPSIPYLCGHHVALREKVASQAVGDLAGIDLAFFFLAAAIARSIDG